MTNTTNSKAPAAAPLTPENLIERFCHVGDVGDLANPTLKDGVLTCQGFCGYEGGQGDSLSVGFDDGSAFIDYLTHRGWIPLPDKGKPPFEVYAAFSLNGILGIARFCEGNLDVSQFYNASVYWQFHDALI